MCTASFRQSTMPVPTSVDASSMHVLGFLLRIFQMQKPDALARLLEQRIEILAGRRRPADIELEVDQLRVRVLDEQIEAVCELRPRLELHRVVVVRDAHAGSRELRALLIQQIGRSLPVVCVERAEETGQRRHVEPARGRIVQHLRDALGQHRRRQHGITGAEQVEIGGELRDVAAQVPEPWRRLGDYVDARAHESRVAEGTRQILRRPTVIGGELDRAKTDFPQFSQDAREIPGRSVAQRIELQSRGP